MKKKTVLFVLSSHNKKGDKGGDTGYHLGEVAHPWKVLHDAGVEMDLISPKGGEPPVDGFDLKDPINLEFWENPIYKEKRTQTKKPNEVDPKNYDAIFFAGGHGTMWDFPNNEELQRLAREIYERGGIVAAVCHGPAIFSNLKLSDGTPLVAGKRVNGFTNEEEMEIKHQEIVPYSLEDKLKSLGAVYKKSPPWTSHVEVDNRLITGQNPQSATNVGHAILKSLESIE